LDGSSHANHHGNIAANELPLDHQYIVIHPVNPCPDNFYSIYERFKTMSDETVPPEEQLGE
jgi:hypothetical protein